MIATWRGMARTSGTVNVELACLDIKRVDKNEGEEAKIAVRNLRRDANEHLKRLTKDKEISEDEERRATDEIQKMTDRAVVDIDKIVVEKEKEIMTV